MSIPVTTRLDQATVDALDRAVAAGLAPHRGAVIVAALREWLAAHGEDAIVDSYRRRYREADPAHEALVEELAAFSAAAILASRER